MVSVPFEAFDTENKCMLLREGCEDISWIREQFGDPVPITQEFIRTAYLRYRGVGICYMLDKYVPEALAAEHAEFVKAAHAEYRDEMRRVEADLVSTGDEAAYEQALSIAFLRYRGKRFGALEGAFTPSFLPYY